MSVTDDRSDPDLQVIEPSGMQKKYLVLSAEERSKGFVRPLRRSYTHQKCGTSTRMGLELCETYARQPSFYSGTYCTKCRTHLPVGEFLWDEDGAIVGS